MGGTLFVNVVSSTSFSNVPFTFYRTASPLTPTRSFYASVIDLYRIYTMPRFTSSSYFLFNKLPQKYFVLTDDYVRFQVPDDSSLETLISLFVRVCNCIQDKTLTSCVAMSHGQFRQRPLELIKFSEPL